MPVGFRGVVLTSPGVATYIDDSQATGAVSAVATSVAIVGAAERGEPNVALAFNDAASAQTVYGTGSAAKPLVDGIIRALNAGAGTVYGVRVGRAKPFSAILKSGTTQSISVVTKEYGRYCKAWSLAIASSTVNSASGGRKVTLTIHDGRQYVVDNIYKPLLNIISTNSTAAALAISTSSLSITKGSSTYTYNLADYPRLGILISAINADTACTASLASGADSNYSSLLIDQKASVAGNIPASTGTPVVVTGTTAAIVDALNGSVLGPFLNASLSSTVETLDVAVYNFTYYLSTGATFTGYITSGTLTVESVTSGTIAVGQVITGSDGSTNITANTTIKAGISGSGGTGTYSLKIGSVDSSQTLGSSSATFSISGNAVEGSSSDYEPDIIASDWTSAFVALQNVPAYFVVPMTGIQTYHATALAHVLSMSLPTGRGERLAILGGSANESASQAKARAAALNDKRAVLCWPGIKAYDDTGSLVTLAPYYLAAQVAGVLAAQGDPSEPLTNKTIGLYGLESTVSNSVIDDLISNGVFTIRNEVGRGFVVVQSLTTWTGDLKFSRREISTIRAADEVMKTVRSVVTPFVGRKSTTSLVGEIKDKVQNALTISEARGLIVADPTNPTLYPSYSNLSVRVYGDAYYVDFSCSPAKPANYMLITAYVS